MFYEIADDKIARPRISGKEVYCRVFIRRVYPCVESRETGEIFKTEKEMPNLL